MVGKCVYKNAGGEVLRSHGSATTAWTPIYVNGIGVCVPQVSADASPSIPTKFFTTGVFRFAITTAVTVSQGDKLYYDSAAFTVQKTQPTTGFFLGTAVEAGTAAGGYVDVQINTSDAAITPDLTNIYVSPNGDDTEGDGSFARPYKTLAIAIAAITTTRKTVVMFPGEYTHTTDTDITVNGTKIIGMGGVSVTASGVTTYGLKTVFGATSGTKEFTLENLSWDSGAKVGLQLQNTGATAKINGYIKNCDFSATNATYSSIDVDHAVTGQAIRLYVDGCTTEGKIDWVVNDNGDRLRFTRGNMRGGLVTSAGDFDAEFFIGWSTFLLNGITGGHANQRVIFAASVSETDADPNVYLEAVDADVQTQTPQTIAFDAP
jgi:predicted RecA/RadA family phage recombinase